MGRTPTGFTEFTQETGECKGKEKGQGAEAGSRDREHASEAERDSRSIMHRHAASKIDRLV
jgi:hypothetical protein